MRMWSGCTAEKSEKKQQQEDKVQRSSEEMVAAEETGVNAAVVLSEQEGDRRVTLEGVR